MATTSGTYNAELMLVNDYIEQAFARCGKTSSTISGEQQLKAKRELYLLLLSLANRGLSLWCIDRRILGLESNSLEYSLPAYYVDVLQSLYRNVTLLTGTPISGAGWTGLDLGAGNEKALYNAAVKLGAATAAPNLVVEGSPDGVAWTQYSVFPNDALPANTWACADLNDSAALRYWRVRDLSAVPGVFTQANFSVLPQEIPMTKLNRDDYIMLPNKTFSTSAGQQSLQYWFDKKISPSIWIWPESQASEDQIVVWAQRQIQDVGSLTNYLDVPARWQPYVTAELAYRTAFLLPKGELDPSRLAVLKSEAQEALAGAEDGETDGAPIRFALGIRGYTR